VTIREEQAITALEVMGRFAANPKWLIYLPPTMSPCETSQEPEWLEHPAEAFAYYRYQGGSQGGLRRETHGVAGGEVRSRGFDSCCIREPLDIAGGSIYVNAMSFDRNICDKTHDSTLDVLDQCRVTVPAAPSTVIWCPVVIR
jgi:hypothetical protein